MAGAGQTIEDFDEFFKGFMIEVNGLVPDANILEEAEAATIQEVQRDDNKKSVPKYKKKSNCKLVLRFIQFYYVMPAQ